jgi:hypothetical protein
MLAKATDAKSKGDRARAAELHAEIAIAEGAPPILTHISTALGLEVPNKPKLRWRFGFPLLELPVVFE